MNAIADLTNAPHDVFRVAAYWLTDSAANYVLSSLIILFFVYWAWRFLRETSQASRDLKKAVSTLNRYPDGKSLKQDFPSFTTTIAGNPTMKHAWREFSETLIVGDEEAPIIRNVHDSHFFFSDQSIISSSLDLSHWRAVPNYLTGFGILGTFIGLVAGIYMANSGLTATDPEIVNQSLGRLLAGASLAFLTSVCGLSSSIVFTGLLHRRLHGMRQELAKWNSLLDERLELVTLEALTEVSNQLARRHVQELQNQSDELRRQTGQLQAFNTDMAIAIAEALDTRIGNRLGATLERLIVTVEGLSQQQKGIGQDAIERMVGDFSEKLSGGAGVAIEGLKTTVEDLKVLLGETIDGFRSSQEEIRCTNQELAKELRQAALDTSSQMQNNYSSAADSLRGSIAAAADKMSNDMMEASERAKQSVIEGSNALEEQLGKVSSEFTESAHSLTKAAARFQQASETLDSTVTRVATYQEAQVEATEIMSAAAKKFGDILSSAAEMVSMQADNADDIKDSAESVAKSVEVVQQCLSSLVVATDTMESSWSDYESRFGDVDNALGAVVEGLNQGAERYTNQIRDFHKELDKHTGDAISRLSAAVVELGELLEDLDERFARE
jgi:hypothetical protein